MDKLKITDVIGKFGGEPGEDVEIFIDRLETAANLFGDSEGLALLLPLFLTKNAYCTWKQMDKDKKNNIDEIKCALRRVFGMTKSCAWKELKGLSWVQGDSVDVLCERIETLLKVVTDGKAVADELISSFFLDSLPIRIREHIHLLHGEKLVKNDVVSAAKSMLSQTQVNFHNVYVGFGDISCGKNEGNIINKRITNDSSNITNSNNENNKINFDSVNKKPNVRCFCCKKIGHTRSNCHIRCFSCGRNGHFSSTCLQGSGNGPAEATSSKN